MRKIQVGAIYKHFKGNYYLVEGIARDCNNLEEVVVYRQLYDDCRLWVRPLDDFMSEVDHVKYPEVKEKYRFELQKIKKK